MYHARIRARARRVRLLLLLLLRVRRIHDRQVVRRVARVVVSGLGHLERMGRLHGGKMLLLEDVVVAGDQGGAAGDGVEGLVSRRADLGAAVAGNGCAVDFVYWGQTDARHAAIVVIPVAGVVAGAAVAVAFQAGRGASSAL